MCVTCHKPGSANANVTSVFYQSDAANVFNRFNGYSNGIAPAKKMFTSHNWAGSEVAPEAGASRPTNAALNPATLGTNLSCARCHNIHLAKSTATNSAPFLRTLNNDDQMCRDCHRSRDTSNQMMGSHPINLRYTSATSKVVTKPTDYYSAPVNANPANPSAALKLVNGKVMCSTCHATHYADSNSGTVDARGTWANLSSSRGMLLRTDTFGKTDTSKNICTNCHNRPNHQVYAGSKTNSTPIQCVDCHSGHVEYIKPEDVALGGDNAKPNVFMLRRYVNYSAGVKLNSYRRKAFLTSTSSTSTLKNANGTAICQACHALPATVSEHATATTKDQCVACHEGGSHAVSAPVGCTGCHGSPPEHTAAGTLVKGGYAVYSSRLGVPQKSYNTSTAYKNESTAGHPTHAAGKPYSFGCSQCHNKQDATHDKQSYQDAPFNAAGVYSPATVFTPGATTSTCASTYCHSYGTATLTKAKTVNWTAGIRDAANANNIVKSATRCIKCHNGVLSATYNNLSTNSHFRHVSLVTTTGKNLGCVVCHSATVSNNTTISNYGNHVNNARELAVDPTFIGGKLVGSTLSGTTCSTYCHTDGKGNGPVTPLNWTSRASGKCDSCHKTATNTYGFGIITSNAHFTHISSSYGPKRNTNALCNNCHVFGSLATSDLDAGHVNGTVDKLASNLCVNCHAQSTPNWFGGSRLSCESCHSGRGNGSVDTPANRSWSAFDATGVRAPFKAYSTFTNRGHGQFAGVYCTDCHNNNSKHLNGATSAAGTYRGARIFANYSGMNATYSADKLCVSCHNDAGHGGNGTVTAPARINLLSHVVDRTPTISYCISCHDTHGSANKMGIKTVFNVMTGNGRGAAVRTVTFNNMTTGFVNKTRTGLCQVCHTRTKYYRNYTAATYNSSPVAYSGSWGHSGGQTRCLNCHNHAAAGFAFAPAGGGACDGCHGYPPKLAENATKTNPIASSDIHLSHNMASKNITDDISGSATGTACTTCHSGHGISPVSTSIVVNATYKFNGASATTYSSNSCSNVSCHFKASPAWK
jgi:predicted CxxxxCH...CXXCH cytochrome family protein